MVEWRYVNKDKDKFLNDKKLSGNEMVQGRAALPLEPVLSASTDHFNPLAILWSKITTAGIKVFSFSFSPFFTLTLTFVFVLNSG